MDVLGAGGLGNASSVASTILLVAQLPAVVPVILQCSSSSPGPASLPMSEAPQTVPQGTCGREWQLPQFIIFCTRCLFGGDGSKRWTRPLVDRLVSWLTMRLVD